MKNIPLSPSHYHNPDRPRFIKDRIEMAFRILGGIPEENVRLASWFATNGKRPKPDCGTIACGLGWLALHPFFKELGAGVFKDTSSSYYPALQGADGWIGFSLARRLFCTEHGDYDAAEALFDRANDGVWDSYLKAVYQQRNGVSHWIKPPDKALLLLRLKYAHQHFSA